MRFISCSDCGATINDDANACPRCSNQPRPKYAGLVAALCNCASLALVLALYTSKADVSPQEPAAAQAAGAPAGSMAAADAVRWPLPCGDDRDCLAGAEFAYAPARPLRH
jgi:hypothetical protein